MSKTILTINSSGRHVGSVSRQLTDQLSSNLQSLEKDLQIISRDVSQGLPFVNDTMIGGLYIPDEQRSSEQLDALKKSNELVKEFADAEVLIFGIPIYNFTVPASLKAYIDLICRMGITFKYSETGPEPLLLSRKTYVIVTSGGTEVRSDIDFATDYFFHILGFLGIKKDDITLIDAGGLMFNGEQKLNKVKSVIDAVNL